jgi:DNA-binding phage protein
MKVKTRPFDPAVHPNSEPEMAAYMFEALDTNDRAFIADARGVVARHGKCAGCARAPTESGKR